MKKNSLKVQNISTNNAINIWKITAGSNIFIIGYPEIIIIDTGEDRFSDELKNEIEKRIDLQNIKHVILTHLHYDHVGNIDLFPAAKIYASKKEIDDFKLDPFGAVLDEKIINKLKKRTLNPIKDFSGLQIINSPGHTKGSICIFYPSQNILFTGDTYFYEGVYGRTDLPTSAPDHMPETISKLHKYKNALICPGHDY